MVFVTRHTNGTQVSLHILKGALVLLKESLKDQPWKGCRCQRSYVAMYGWHQSLLCADPSEEYLLLMLLLWNMPRHFWWVNIGKVVWKKMVSSSQQCCAEVQCPSLQQVKSCSVQIEHHCSVFTSCVIVSISASLMVFPPPKLKRLKCCTLSL